jgi:hypothetical protein
VTLGGAYGYSLRLQHANKRNSEIEMNGTFCHEQPTIRRDCSLEVTECCLLLHETSHIQYTRFSFQFRPDERGVYLIRPRQLVTAFYGEIATHT